MRWAGAYQPTGPGSLTPGHAPPAKRGYHAQKHVLKAVNSLTLDVLVLTVAVALDRFLPELPNSIHPVVWTGRIITALEGMAPRRPVPVFLFGGFIVLVVVGGCGIATWWVMAGLQTMGDLIYVAGGALVLRTTFAVRGLCEAAEQTQSTLTQGRWDEARVSLRSLVSRDPAPLTPPLVAAAAIESVAENTTDSFVGPWLAFAVLGVPGAVAYRALNTLDSMLGYRGAYEYLGKISARLDDVVNLIPARLSAVLILAGGLLSRLPAGRGWRIMVRDHGLTASPNAGWTMGAMAGLLGIRLEKPGHYCLGADLHPPDAGDIGRAVGVAEETAALALLLAIALLAVKFTITG